MLLHDLLPFTDVSLQFENDMTELAGRFPAHCPPTQTAYSYNQGLE